MSHGSDGDEAFAQLPSRHRLRALPARERRNDGRTPQGAIVLPVSPRLNYSGSAVSHSSDSALWSLMASRNRGMMSAFGGDLSQNPFAAGGPTF
jgi:hypothetical protein